MDHAAKMILVPAGTAIGASAMTAGNIEKSSPCRDGDMFQENKKKNSTDTGHV